MLTLALASLLSPALIQLLFVIVIIGVCLFLIERFIPMDDAIKTVLRVVVVLAIVYWLLQYAKVI